MPWKVEKRPIDGKKDWAILKKKDGEWVIVGRSESKKEAEASVRARAIGAHSKR
jgi:hypothetical protein